MATLKRSSDGLSKSWGVNGSVKPFFSGGKVVISQDPSKLYCLHDGALSSLDLTTSAISTNILADKSALAAADQGDDDMREDISCFCVHPDGEEVVVATTSYLLKHYNIKTGALLRTVRGNYNMPILCLAYDATGTLVATGSTDCVVRVWDIVKGYCTHTFRAHTDIIPLVAFCSWGADVGSPANSLLLCSCSDDRSIQLHDLQTSSTATAFRQHMSTPTDVAFNNQFALLKSSTLLMASCGRDRVINLFDMRTHAHLKTVPVPEEELETVVFIGGGGGYSNGSGKKISMGTSSLAKKASKGKTVGNDSHNNSEMYRLICGGSSGLLKMFEVSIVVGTAAAVTCQLTLQLDTLQQGSILTNLLYLRRSEDHNSKVVAVTSEHCFHFFTVETEGKDKDEVADNKAALTYDHVQIDGNLDDILDVLMLTGSVVDDDSVNTNENKQEDDSAAVASASASALSAVHAHKLAVITNSSNLRIMNASFQTVQHLSGHEDTIMALDCNNDCKLIVTGSKDNSCRLWQWQEEREEFVCCAAALGHTGAVGAVCIAQRQATYQSKQAFVISGSHDRTLKRWVLNMDAINKSMAVAEQQQQQQQEMPLDYLVTSHSTRAHEKDINSVASAPNDSVIASGSQDRTIKLWNPTDLTLVATLSGHKRGVWKVVFSPIDRCLLSASADRTLRLWSLQDYSCIRTFQGHTSSVLCAKFINRGMQILSGAADGVLKLWTIRSGECENTFDEEHSDRIWCIATPREEPSSAVGRFCVTGSSDGSLRRWMDRTSADEETQLQEEENKYLVEQSLNNDLRNKKYDKALAGALELNHSKKVYNIFAAILADTAGEHNNNNATKLLQQESELDSAAAAVSAHWKSSTLLLGQMLSPAGTDADAHLPISVGDACKKLDKYVLKLSKSDLCKVLNLMSEWNTNAKYAHVCHMLLDSLLRNVNLAAYLTLSAGSGSGSSADEDTLALRRLLPQLLPGLLAYSERHYQRLDKLNQASYLVDHMCSSMNTYTQLNLDIDGGVSSTAAVITAAAVSAKTAIGGSSKRSRSLNAWDSGHGTSEQEKQDGNEDEDEDEPLVVFKKSKISKN